MICLRLFILLFSVALFTYGQSVTQRVSLNSPIRFEPNAGQVDPETRYIARGGGLIMALSSQEAVIALGTTPVRMKLPGAAKHSVARAEGLLPSVTNYYLGD